MIDNYHCQKVEDTVILYQTVGIKLYILNRITVIPITDEYYFVNEHQRNVENFEEYSKYSTRDYYCSTLRECEKLKPTEGEYYQNDNSKWSTAADADAKGNEQ